MTLTSRNCRSENIRILAVVIASVGWAKARSAVPIKASQEALMSRCRRLKIEGERFSSRSRLPTVEAICWSASVNERVGTARSLSSGRAKRGPVDAFAHPALAPSHQSRLRAPTSSYIGNDVVSSDNCPQNGDVPRSPLKINWQSPRAVGRHNTILKYWNCRITDAVAFATLCARALSTLHAWHAAHFLMEELQACRKSHWYLHCLPPCRSACCQSHQHKLR